MLHSGKGIGKCTRTVRGHVPGPKNRLGENSVTVSRLTIHELHDLLVNKEISATELTQEHLNRIQALDGDVNAYITVTGDLALEQAKAVDAKIAAGETIGALAGIPMAVKIICVQKASTPLVPPKCWRTLSPSTAPLW